MPVIAIRRIPTFEPELEFEPAEFVPEKNDSPGYTIGAHADFCREDFIFPRMQSRSMRETPWGARARPIKSWSQLAGMGMLFALASCALFATTAFI